MRQPYLMRLLVVFVLILIGVAFYIYNNKIEPVDGMVSREEYFPQKSYKQRLEKELDKAAEKVDINPPVRQEGWVAPDNGINTSTDARMP